MSAAGQRVVSVSGSHQQDGGQLVLYANVFVCCSVVVQNLISGSMFLICYCDYGDIVVINSDRLKVLPASFRQLPALAISARLSGK